MMNGMRVGFSLLEFLVYLALLSTFLLLLFQFLSGSVVRLASSGRFIQGQVTGHIVRDLVMRDVQAARADTQFWIVRPSLYVWSLGEHEVGWALEHDVLYRMIGNYNFQEGRWTKVTKAYIARDIKSFVLEPKIFDSQVVQVLCLLEGAVVPVTTAVVPLCNRVLL